MHKIAIIGQKGGTGKSLLCANLAVAAARTGAAVVCIDLDPQTSLTRWHDRRSKTDPAAENPLVVSVQGSRLKKTEEAMLAGGADWLFVDVAGRSESAAIEAARGASLVLVPVSDDLVELETLPTVRDIVQLAGNPPCLAVLNCMHPSATKLADEVRTAIQSEFGLLTMPGHMCRRDSYSQAWTPGRTPQEIDPAGAAAREIAELFRFVTEFVETGETTHEQDGRHQATA